MRKPEFIDVRAALPNKPSSFLDQLRIFIRSLGLACSTEKLTYFGFDDLSDSVAISLQRTLSFMIRALTKFAD